MADELRLASAFALSLVAVLVLVPLVIRIATRTRFVDRPGGYKAHLRVTPYLGGLAIAVAVIPALFVFGAATSRFAALLIWAFVLFVVGTVDDKRNLNPSTRLVVEIIAAVALWHYGLGWDVFGSNAANIALTIMWVVGLVNAFNLMDNMDGAAGSVAGVSAAGIATMGAIYGDIALAVIGMSLAGACVGFLRYNLAKPAKIFLGDGGSMPIGLLIAGAVMAAPGTQGLGWSAILAVTPMVGLPILDTTLVVISRRRGGRPVLAGGRDHLTHRLGAMLGSARIVAGSLGLVQTVLCLTVIGLSQVDHVIVTIGGGIFVVAAALAIYTLETPGRGRLAAVARALPTDSVTPERSAA